MHANDKKKRDDVAAVDTYCAYASLHRQLMQH